MSIYSKVSHIYTYKPSGGSILQSAFRAIPGIAQTFKEKGYIHTPIVAQALKDREISMVALTAKDLQVPLNQDQPPELTFDVLHLPFDDDQNLSDHQMEKVRLLILAGAQKMADAVKEGRHVLSTCAAGINRSSLLTIHTIKLLQPDLNPVQIVNQIRNNRDRSCLNNVLFQDVVFREAWM